MKFAYADPPYLGCGKLYLDYHPDSMIWDDPQTHKLLIERLCNEYPDGWALSLHEPSLRTILPMTPTDCRTGAWVKPFAFWRNYPIKWEPVIFRGGRKPKNSNFGYWCMANAPRTSLKDRFNPPFPGRKPRTFCRWIFGQLGAEKGDQLDDLFPGSNAVTAAWAEWVNEVNLDLPLFTSGAP